MTVAEHVQWARGRAHEYVDRGKPNYAVASMISDLRKHEGINQGVVTGCAIAAACLVEDCDNVRRWIDACFPSVPVVAR